MHAFFGGFLTHTTPRAAAFFHRATDLRFDHAGHTPIFWWTAAAITVAAAAILNSAVLTTRS